ncbi:MAG: ABC transporter ATP-binding protein [Formosimonas sp.]
MLRVSQLYKNYAATCVLDNVSFELAKGDIACLLGPSGSGKTTTLRLIAGFEHATQGRIEVNRVCVDDAHTAVPAHERQIGMVFQDHALFPHLSVADNIGFGLHGLSRSARTARVAQLLDLIQLPNLAARLPHELSGGQQQRVALARALAPKPQLVLLDEPFSNLDQSLREQLAQDVRSILQQEKISALMVTHDQHEAFAIADFMGVMHQGTLAQWDTPYNMYHTPHSRTVARFIGQGAFLPATFNDGCVSCELGQFAAPVSASDKAVDILLRPDDVVHIDGAPFTARVVSKVFNGGDFLYTLALPSGQHILAQVPSHHRHAIGEWIGVTLDLSHVVAFAQNA